MDGPARCPGCGVVCVNMNVQHASYCRYQGRDALQFPFKRGRRYKLTFFPAGARTKTVTRTGNYLGTQWGDPLIDCRPDGGTQLIPLMSVRDAEDVGEAVYS